MNEELASGLILVTITLLLSHFFEDSDRHRGALEKMRAKYLSLKSAYDSSVSCEDCINLKLYDIHFGTISIIVFLGLSLMLAVAGNLACVFYAQENFFWFAALLITCVILVFVQITFIDQQKGASRRLKDFDESSLSKRCLLRSRCDLISYNKHLWEKKISHGVRYLLKLETPIVFVFLNFPFIVMILWFR